MMPHVYAIILAGGSGTRFWPASRRALPKQLLPLAGRPNEPLIAATVRRIEPLVPLERVWVATGSHLVAATPVARNTAPCIGWASATIARADPEAIVAVLPADHFIGDEAAFREVIERALGAAEQGWLTTVGVVPTRPETGYGYIEVGEPVAPGVHGAVRFVEKPSAAAAEQFVATGRYLWNAGMFFFRAKLMREAIETHVPALAAGLERIEAAAALGAEERALADVFPGLPSISIDHAVMEKAQRIAVVPGRFDWNDVGSWQVAWEMAERDSDGNALPEGSVAIDAKGNLVKDWSRSASAKRWALVGVDDLVIIETDDAVLVVPRSRVQDVRAVVAALETRGETELL